ncbi:hypothetical protein DY000_02028914 [Brassica cretica]|uniref:Uncharacterized protein n=1 Tax=Brassica cretica TaxID=69181 RepID=A0ABQ7DXY1_BRACR|nr:hypothetical protein DY000_02028914 [Brassica cretica]
MECSYLTVDFFRKLSTDLRMLSVLLGCGRCGSDPKETFRERESVSVLSSVRGLYSCRNGDPAKLERFGMRGLGAVAKSNNMEGYLGLKDF